MEMMESRLNNKMFFQENVMFICFYSVKGLFLHGVTF